MTSTIDPPHALLDAPAGGSLRGAGGQKEAVLSGLRKAAILLVTLGSEASSRVLRQLSEDEAEMISREVARLPSISDAEAQAVLDEFQRTSLGQAYVLEGGIDYAKKMLTDAYGPDAGLSIVERLMKSMGADAANFDAFQKIDPRQLAKLVYNEHPQIIALILSHLVSAQAASLLVALPAELRPDVVKRMATLEQLSPDIIAKIAAFIGRRLKALGEFSRESYGGVRAVAEMLNRLETGVSEELLTKVGEGDAGLSETIRNLMFVFEDIQKIDTEEMKLLVAKVDRKVLSVALKGTSPKISSHFTACMSQRAAEMLREDMEALGPVKIKDVEAAQHQIITLVRQLQSEGVLSTQAAGGDKYIT